MFSLLLYAFSNNMILTEEKNQSSVCPTKSVGRSWYCYVVWMSEMFTTGTQRTWRPFDTRKKWHKYCYLTPYETSRSVDASWSNNHAGDKKVRMTRSKCQNYRGGHHSLGLSLPVSYVEANLTTNRVTMIHFISLYWSEGVGTMVSLVHTHDPR
jgi:hypothetical protein